VTVPRRALTLTPPQATAGIAPALDGVPYLDALAALHAARGAGRYIEIGIDKGHSLALARGAAIGIDPVFAMHEPVWINKTALHLFQMTSDDFFRQHDPRALLGGALDLAFIDGMHHAEYALRDLINIERHMARDGIVILHDCLPWNFHATRRLARTETGYEPVIGGWAGDCWKTLALVQEARPDITVTLLDAPPTGLALLTNLDPDSDTLQTCYDTLVERALGPLADQAAFRTWLGAQQVVDSRAWLAAGCPA